MRILMIGNDPKDIAGVANYSRPLALKFSEFGHQVFYLYSGAWNKKYNWRITPYIKTDKKSFPFECAEVINSPNWTTNYGSPLIDIKVPETERLFKDYLKKINPDIMHVHSRLGLPASILEVASSKGITVFNTIHVYGTLCQKRVMIDSHGKLCNGPSDIEKCASCTGTLNLRKLRFAARIEYTSKGLLSMFIHAKRAMQPLNDKKNNNATIALSGKGSKEAATGLRKRLEYMINLMNNHVYKNICVSTDVKKTLLHYGVRENKLLVQHIGSVIAESQKEGKKAFSKPLVIGNIGGVGYYKGTHILIDAVNKIKKGNFVVKIFGKYMPDYIREIMGEREHLPIEFLGKYLPEDIPEILDQIDIMVLPSICNDTAPQTIFESYSRRIPIIASNIGGFPDFIKDRESGLLFKVGDSGDLAEKLDMILNAPERILEFSSRIPRLKTITENALELLSLYQERGRDN